MRLTQQGGEIDIEISVVNHEDRILPANKFGVYVELVGPSGGDEYWKDLPKLEWIDKKLGSKGSHSVSFTANSKTTIPLGEYKFQACIFNETNKCVDWSAIRTVEVI